MKAKAAPTPASVKVAKSEAAADKAPAAAASKNGAADKKKKKGGKPAKMAGFGDLRSMFTKK